MDDYNIDIYNISSLVVYNLLNVLQNNKALDLSDDNPLFTLLLVIIGKDFYDPKEVYTLQREINKTISTLSFDELVLNCSRFISNVGRETKMLKRFENIFIKDSIF